MKPSISALFFMVLVMTVSATADPRILVGAIQPLSGEFEAEGRLIQQGIELSLAGNPSCEVEVRYEDDKSLDPLATASATQSLITVNHAAAVFEWLVQGAKVMAPIASRAGVPVFVVWDSNQELREMGPLVHGVGIETERTAQEMARFVKQNLKVDRVSLIKAEDAWVEMMAREFQKEYERLGGSVDRAESHAATETNFAPTVARLRAQSVPGAYMLLFGSSRVSFVKEAKRLGYKGAVFTGDFLSEELKALGSDADGVYSTVPWSDDEKLAALYRQRYGREITNVDLGFVALAHEAMRQFCEGVINLKQSGAVVDAAAIQKYFEKNPTKPWTREVIARAKNGRFEKIM